MSDFKQRHRRAYGATLVLAAGTSLLLGSGLLAVITDSVTSQGNSVQSATYTRQDLKATRVAAEAPCPADPTAYEDALSLPSFMLSNAIIDLEQDLAAASGQYRICVLNNGSQAGTLAIAPANAVDSEVGCSDSEVAAGDTSCTNGDAGELKPLLKYEALACFGPPALARLEGASPAVFGDFFPGGPCDVEVRVWVEGGTPQQRAAAQTDKVQWDFVFTLS